MTEKETLEYEKPAIVTYSEEELMSSVEGLGASGVGGSGGL